MERNFPHEKGLIDRRVEREPWGTRFQVDRFPILPEKIVFLNDENLEAIKGYKAGVEVFGGLLGRQEVHIVLTGFSPTAAKRLYDSLRALPPNEIRGQ